MAFTGSLISLSRSTSLKGIPCYRLTAACEYPFASSTRAALLKAGADHCVILSIIPTPPHIFSDHYNSFSSSTLLELVNHAYKNRILQQQAGRCDRLSSFPAVANNSGRSPSTTSTLSMRPKQTRSSIAFLTPDCPQAVSLWRKGTTLSASSSMTAPTQIPWRR